MRVTYASLGTLCRSTGLELRAAQSEVGDIVADACYATMLGLKVILKFLADPAHVKHYAGDYEAEQTSG